MNMGYHGVRCRGESVEHKSRVRESRYESNMVAYPITPTRRLGEKRNERIASIIENEESGP